MRRALLRGMRFASLGALLLLLTGTLLPLRLLSVIGPFAFPVGITFILLGLRPYRRLSSLQSHPDALHFGRGGLHYLQRGRPQLCLPLEKIRWIDFASREGEEGILLHFQEEELFFPYFTQETAEELKVLLAECHAS